MVTGLDWGSIRKELDSMEWEKEPFEDYEVRMVFVGTVFNLVPSGKFYTPWACSNVTEEEAERDEEWREEVEAECEENGCFITSGEGDPCDLFVGEIRDIDEEN